MAGTDLTPSLDKSLVKVRWEEPYVSDGLNRKLFGAVPRGIVRAGNLQAHASVAMNVTVNADPIEGDIVVAYGDTEEGRQMTVRFDGEQSVDLTNVASTTAYLCLYVEYATGVDTVIKWRGYSYADLFGASPVDEADSVIVFGKIDVPASGLISSSDVYQDGRTEAWMKRGTGLIEWIPLLRNGDFEQKWNYWDEVDSPEVSLDETTKYSGARSAKYSFTLPGIKGITKEFGYFPVVPGQLVAIRFMVKGDSVPTDPTYNIAQIALRDKDGGSAGIATLATIPSGTYDWKEVVGVAKMPTNAAFLDVFVVATGESPGGTGTMTVWIDELQVLVQVRHPMFRIPEQSRCFGLDRFKKLRFGDDIRPLTDPPDFLISKTTGGSGKEEIQFQWEGPPAEDAYMRITSGVKLVVDSLVADADDPPQDNMVFGQMQARAFGQIDTNGGTPTIVRGLNIATVVKQSVGVYRHTFNRYPGTGLIVQATVSEFALAGPSGKLAKHVQGLGDAGPTNFDIYCYAWNEAAGYWELTDSLIYDVVVYSTT